MSEDYDEDAARYWHQLRAAGESCEDIAEEFMITTERVKRDIWRYRRKIGWSGASDGEIEKRGT